ncbi:MAG: hypothetical protein A2X61_13225 [Ignavibacteria bacterium GWB2_35_12]|nr:MAG: hypothetical protein A2X63_12435 [Ignavibacteria bacterium GWA2_35_8]OGU41422.1 MAG: hypothetical protein A2X61_13225 [Ignavibacteria bacterium GWB2_35_12]OGU95015.1 MAG: hypothetical protein A2220_09615 [Ignavibacteria bacterium RIFOXYA2_FULL_35_10]OGV19402.1 MAG: hypothetical protein A2475_04865 [Ignavibacteria bacterium RIFOXYC2_FULL_35_21]
MKKIITLFLSLLFLAISGESLLSQPQTGDFNMQYDDRGTISTISFWVPIDYDSKSTYPFLLAWHGAGDNGQNMRYIIKILLAQRVNAILACPDANNLNGKEWSYLLNLTSETYNYVRTTYNVDTTKMISMGYSWGGGIAYQLGLWNPTMFNGIIGLAPAIGKSQFDSIMWSNIMNIRMATILGDKDFNYSAVNLLMTNIQDSGAALLYLIKPGVEHVDNDYFNSQEIIDDFRQCYDYVTYQNTGVNELVFNESDLINIYPNPTFDLVNLKINTTTNNPAFIKILDLKGNVIYENTIHFSSDNSDAMVDISKYQSGVYFMEIRIGKEIFHKKIVKLD